MNLQDNQVGNTKVPVGVCVLGVCFRTIILMKESESLSARPDANVVRGGMTEVALGA